MRLHFKFEARATLAARALPVTDQHDKGLGAVPDGSGTESRGRLALRARGRRRSVAAQRGPLQGAARLVSPATPRPRVCRTRGKPTKPLGDTVGWSEHMTERMPQGGGLPLVLLAGDGQEATRWLRSLLEGGGYAVLQERSGQHALERARTTEPDVILVDAEMPDMPGVELCRALRSDPRVSSSTPILLMIREAATRTQRLAALRAGAWECIAPPHDADEILLKIGAYVHAKLDADRARTEGLLDATTGLYNRQGLARRAREMGSQAFREHGPLACIVLALDVEPPDLSAAQQHGGTTLGRYVQAIKSAARLSDVIGRLSATEFAVLAPGTDAAGARRLAERLASSVSGTTVASTGGTATAASVSVRCGYEAVANVGYAPIEPVDLLVRAAAAVRTGRADSGGWLRRFDEGVNPASTTP